MARFKKAPAGTLRSKSFTVRMNPSCMGRVKEKLAEMRGRWPDRDFTISELMRLALWEYCKLPDDPRQP